ncbi:alpha/beta hydrolase [Bacillus sp. 2205SS5-2]|uniref:alpha/beta hydrolase n=1 Tax=Bacillus sp. 2205SS5-2 TaxID=3109031 RepID=UPI0030067C0E
MEIKEVQSPFYGQNSDNELYETIKSRGTPIIETDNDGVYIHFIYFGNQGTNSVHILGSFPGWELEKGEMVKLEGSHIWVKSFKISHPLASTYYFSVNDNYGDNWGERFKHFVTDPLNPSKMIFSESPTDKQKNNTELSYLTFNEAIHSVDFPSKNPNIVKHTFTSERLNNQRNLWSYDPIKNVDTPKNLLIIFDGSQYTEAVPVANMIDYLHEEGKLSPTIMVGVDSPDRSNEFNGNNSFNAFLTQELLPWIQSNFNVSHNPQQTALCGASLGGLASFYAAVHHPDLFGKVLSQSGSFNRKKTGEYHDKYWSVDYLESIPRLPIRIYMNAGRLEMEDLQKANLITYQTLMNKGYDVKYDVFSGGHDVLWWRETFLAGLEYLFCVNE